MSKDKWTDKDTSDHSGDSSSKVSHAEHDARDHATKSGDFERGNDEKIIKDFLVTMIPARPQAVSGNPSLANRNFNGQIASAVCPFLNKMNKICNIKYVDAYYDYTERLPRVKLKTHEAYGYVRRNRDSLIVEFIKKIDQDKNDKTITKGLIIPSSAIISKSKKNNIMNMCKGSSVSITWKDIVYVANTTIQKYSKMYSEGVVFENSRNYIILKNPETLRLSPSPIENHPAKKPTFYIIPKSLIIEVEVIT